VISGPCSSQETKEAFKLQVNHMSFDDVLHKDLQKFWELEEVPCVAQLSPDEAACEKHFRETHRRLANGQYEVRLPLICDPLSKMGDTKLIAEKIFESNENRLQRKPELLREYNSFLSEYRDLNHMRVFGKHERDEKVNYISHLPVIRESSQTTKLRVVFNASMRSANGCTLNDCLYVGPKLQNDLTALLLRWRMFRFVYTADIAKMFRQI